MRETALSPYSLPRLGPGEALLVVRQVMLTRSTRALLYDQRPAVASELYRVAEPQLERALPALTGEARPGLATAMALMRAVSRLGSRPWDGNERDEGAILVSGAATPLERARLLARLAILSGIPARICLLYREIEPRFHAVCELEVMGSWAVFDPLANQNYLVTHHPYASAWDLMRSRAIADGHPEHGRKPTIDSSFYRTVGIVALGASGQDAT